MLKKRNAQGISIRVLIIAAIALIVLIVLIAIFTGKLGIFSSGLTKILNDNIPWLGLGNDVDGSPDDGSNGGGEKCEDQTEDSYICKSTCPNEYKHSNGPFDCVRPKRFCCPVWA